MKRLWIIFTSFAALVALSGFARALAQEEPFQVGPDEQPVLSSEARQATIDQVLTLTLEGKGEDVYVVKVITLAPKPDSPVKNLDVIGYVLSDGTEGYAVIGGFSSRPGPPTPQGIEVQEDLETGTYTARELSSKELKNAARQRKGLRPRTFIQQLGPDTPAPEASEPLSGLGKRLLDFFLPSAFACSGGTGFTPCPSPIYSRSFTIESFYDSNTLVATTEGRILWDLAAQQRGAR